MHKRDKRDWFGFGSFVLLQFATLFVLLGGGAAIRFALIATCAPALAVAAVAIGEIAVVVTEIVVVGKNFLLDPLRGIFAPDDIPYPAPQEVLRIPIFEEGIDRFESRVKHRGRVRQERAEFREAVLQQVLDEEWLKKQLHGFELFRFSYLLPQARLALIASLDGALAEDGDLDLKRIRGLFVQEHLHAGRREAVLACA